MQHPILNLILNQITVVPIFTAHKYGKALLALSSSLHPFQYPHSSILLLQLFHKWAHFEFIHFIYFGVHLRLVTLPCMQIIFSII